MPAATSEQLSDSSAPLDSPSARSVAAPFVNRSIEDDGSETVEGVLTVQFEPGQKRANLHVPFSPPLRRAPEIECESVGDADVMLKVAVVQPWGVRIEARRTSAEQESVAEVGFHARSETV